MAVVSARDGWLDVHPYEQGGVVVILQRAGVRLGLTLTLGEASALRAAINTALATTPPRQKETQP